MVIAGVGVNDVVEALDWQLYVNITQLVLVAVVDHSDPVTLEGIWIGAGDNSTFIW